MTKFLDQAQDDIAVTKYLNVSQDPTLIQYLNQAEDDIAVTKYLYQMYLDSQSNDVTVTKFMEQQADDISVTKFLGTASTRFNGDAVAKFLDGSPEV